MVPNSLLYLHETQKKHVNTSKDLTSKLHGYINVIHILSTGYLLIYLINPYQLNGTITQVREALL